VGLDLNGEHLEVRGQRRLRGPWVDRRWRLGQCPEVGERGLAEDGEEPGQVPPVRDGVFRFDPDEQPERGVPPEFFEAGFGGGVPEEDGQEQDAPEDADRVLVAPIVPAGLKGGE
jgi:hypothetical protein